MKIVFEFSASDLADASDRAVNRSKVVRDWHWQFKAFYCIVVALLVFALTPGPTLGRALFAIAVAIALAIYHRNARPSMKSVAYYREQLGGDGPFTCEVELTPEALITRQFGIEAKHQWSYVRSIDEVPDGLEFTYKPFGALLIRERAFPALGKKQEFLALARQFIRNGT